MELIISPQILKTDPLFMRHRMRLPTSETFTLCGRLRPLLVHGERVQAHRPGVGHVNKRRQAMRDVVGRREPVPPVVQSGRNAQAPVFFSGMVVLTLGVTDVADLARLVQTPHFLARDHVRIVLGEHVDLAGLLDGLAELHTLRHRSRGNALAHHVPAGFERLYRERRMVMAVVGQDDGVHVMVQELVVVGIGGDTVSLADLLQARLPRIADGHQFHAHHFPVHKALPAPDADDADTNLLLSSRFRSHVRPSSSRKHVVPYRKRVISIAGGSICWKYFAQGNIESEDFLMKTATRIRETETSVRIGNELMELGFDLKPKGALVSILDRKNKYQFQRDRTAPKTLYRLALRRADRGIDWFDSRDAAQFSWSARDDADRTTIVLQSSGFPGQSLTVTVEVSLKNNSALSAWHMKVTGLRPDQAVDALVCPIISGVMKVGAGIPGESVAAPVQSRGVSVHRSLSDGGQSSAAGRLSRMPPRRHGGSRRDVSGQSLDADDAVLQPACRTVRGVPRRRHAR